MRGQGAGARGLGRVEHGEQLAELGAEVVAVGGGVLLQQRPELGRVEDGGVLGEEAEEQAHQQHLQGVAGVAVGQQRIVELGHELGGLGVGGVFGALGAGWSVAGEEAEQVQVLGQLGQGKVVAQVLVEVVEAQAGKVADEHEAR